MFTCFSKFTFVHFSAVKVKKSEILIPSVMCSHIIVNYHAKGCSPFIFNESIGGAFFSIIKEPQASVKNVSFMRLLDTCRHKIWVKAHSSQHAAFYRNPTVFHWKSIPHKRLLVVAVQCYTGPANIA